MTNLTNGNFNTATGADALDANTSGANNVATGADALLSQHDRQQQRRHRHRRAALQHQRRL